MPFGISAGIAAGGSLLSGIFGKNASKSAAGVQAANANRVASMAGTAASNAENWTNLATTTGVDTLNNAIGGGSTAVSGAIPQANQTLADVLKQQQANVAPYQAAGQQGINTLQSTLQDYMAPGGALSGQFSFNPSDLQNEPGYQFTLDQGLKALNNQASSSGLLQSGSTLKGIENYAQGLAGTQYQNAYNRALTTFQTNRSNALNTLGAVNTLAGYGLPASAQANTALQNYGNLSSSNTMQGNEFLANFGLGGATTQADLLQRGATTAGQFGLQGAQIAGNALTGGANAQAAGIVGGNNALFGGIANATNSIQNYYQMQQLQNGSGYGVSPYGVGVPNSPADWTALTGGGIAPPPTVGSPY
jgi:hypothetical protein